MGKQKNLVIVRSVLQQALSVTAAATKYSVSRQWVYALSVEYCSNKL
ncbi:hypothetical protein GCM10022377_00250 [Zhihengliuella alba]|uniref:Helix-turn-helix domain-containing protein n=1 Tax=Zhihengliuella alba TaxID=547018 RepID=A0ABP7CMY5_9MICC